MDDTIKEALGDWIYAEDLLTQSLDSDLTAQHGIAQIARGLNSNRLIAVVGSGVSRAYGQPSWKDLLVDTADYAMQQLPEQARNKNPSDHPLDRYWKTFTRFGLCERPLKILSAQYPTAFEICENLFGAWMVFKRQKAGEVFSVREELRTASLLLRNRLKWQLRDNRGRVALTLRRLEARAPRTYREEPDFQELTALRELLEFSESPRSEADEARIKLISRWFYVRNGDLSLYHKLNEPNEGPRFSRAMVGALSQFLSVPGAHHAAPKDKDADDPNVYDVIDAHIELLPPTIAIKRISAWGREIAEAAGSATKELAGDRIRSDRAALSAKQDPYAILTEELEIKRFLTTNYDDELDRLLEARGFKEIYQEDVAPPPSDASRPARPPATRTTYIDAVARRADVIACEPGASAYMFEYGADRKDSRIQSLHIHGRARKKESLLVLSQRDYRERYARDDEPQAQTDDAMRQIFNGNPLLFLGLGMTEPDILRPLRAYSDEVSRIIERPAVALLPDKEGDRDVQRRMVALSEYGIYTLLYGTAQVACEDDEGGTVIKDLPLLRALSIIQNFAYEYFAFEGTREHHNYQASINDTSTVRHLPVDSGSEIDEALDVICGKSRGARIDLRRIFERGARTPDINDFGPLPITAIEGRPEFAGAISKLARLARCILYEIHKLGTDKVSVDERHRRRAAGRILTATLLNMALSIFLNARLRRLVDERKAWKDRWSRAPATREPEGRGAVEVLVKLRDAAPPGSDEPASHLRASRHRTLLRVPEQSLRFDEYGRFRPEDPWEKFDRDVGAPATDRYFAGSPSPIFPSMRAALERIPTGSAQPKRRVIFMLGGRGVGRGQVFNAMRNEERFGRLCYWLGHAGTDENGEIDETAVAEINSAFFNIGMSHEVISVFDRLAYLLEQIVLSFARKAGAHVLQEMEREIRSLAHNRIERLRLALRLMTIHAAELKPSIIVFDHFSALFNRDGRPKNAQARQIFEVLTDSQYAAAPIDFIMMMNERFTPINLRTDPRKCVPGGRLDASIKCQWLVPSNLSSARMLELQARLDAAGIKASPVDAAGIEADEEAGCTGFYIFLLDPISPVAIAARFFTRAAVALCLLAKQDGTRARSEDTHVIFRAEQWPRDDPAQYASRKHIPIPREDDAGFGHDEVTRIQSAINAVFKNQNDAKPRIADSSLSPAEVVEHYETGSIDRALLHFLHCYIQGDASDGEDAQDARGIGKIANPRQELVTAWETATAESDHANIAPAAEMFAKIGTICGHNRYAMTALLALIDDMIARRWPEIPQGAINLAPVVDLFTRLKLATSGVEPDGRSDIVIEHILGVYQTDMLSSMGRPLTAWPYALCVPGGRDKSWQHEADWIAGDPQSRDKLLSNFVKELKGIDHDLLYVTQEEMLVAMSLIGQPVDATVLLGIGTIHGAIERIVEELSGKLKQRFSAEVLEACRPAFHRLVLLNVMDLLVHRCLVFRIVPKGDEVKLKGRQFHRFATHKTIRRHVYLRFNSPAVDFADVDQLTVSLYATQPNELPKPSADGHRRVRTMVEQLAGYERPFLAPPFPDKADSADAGDAYGPSKLRISRSRLRAAYGALRSIYSVGVVSRFDTYEEQGMAAPEMGYFEAHRLRVRWLLRKAATLDTDNDGDDTEQKQKPSDLNTFHAEEIVWLFNECGVLSLASGRIDDALQLLIRADLAATQLVEAGKWGALHARIGLNLALAWIEAGDVAAADKLLRKIELDPVETDPIHLIAHGYRGYVKAFRGNTIDAEKHFNHAFEWLNAIGRSRAAAIFQIHHADVVRRKGAGSIDTAIAMLTAARELAANGGHEDIRCLARLGIAVARIDLLGGSGDLAEKLQISRALAEIEDYARKMGMPRLSGRIQLARAQLLIQGGEHRLAAEAAQRALQIATRYGAEILKVPAMARLGQSMLMMGRPGAQRLIVRARDMATNAGYFSEVGAIEALLSEDRWVPQPI